MLEKDTAKEEKLSIEQRRNLALLHDDIDDWVAEFYTEAEAHIALDLTPPQEEEEKPKKPRKIYRCEETSLLTGGEKMEHFYHRMLSITDNLVVRSVTNKLIHFIPTAQRLTIQSSLSHRVIERNLDFFTLRKKILLEQEETSEDEKERLDALTEIEKFMEKHSVEVIKGRTYSDKITFSAFDAEEKELANSVFFQGGVAIPKECAIREPQPRRKRKDKLEMGSVALLTVGKEKYILEQPPRGE